MSKSRTLRNPRENTKIYPEMGIVSKAEEFTRDTLCKVRANLLGSFSFYGAKSNILSVIYPLSEYAG